MNARHTPSLESLLERHREGGAFPTYAELSALATPAAPSEQAEPIADRNAVLWAHKRNDDSAWRGNEVYDDRQCAEDALAMSSFSDSHKVVGLVEAAPAAPLPAQPEQIQRLLDTFPEINMSNYGDDEVSALNEWGIEICRALAVAAPLPELTGPSLTDDEKLQRNIMLGMADCMDMVRTDLIEMGIIDKTVAPMFIPEAVANYCKRLAASPSPAPAQPTLCSDVQYLRNVVEDVKLALRNTDRQPLEVLLEGATAALEKSNVPPLVAAPVSQQDSYSPTIVDCDGLPQAVAAIMGQPRAIVGWANLYELIDAWGEGQRKHVADEQVTSPASRMGGITSKASAETAAPGASGEDGQ